MIPGIDISAYQEGPVGIDWPAVAKFLLGLHPEAFVIVKVNEFDYVNPFLHQQRQGAHAAGIRNVGLYEFGRPSLGSGSQGADLFLKAVGDDGGVLDGEFYCLDLEDQKIPANADLDAYVLDNTGRKGRSSGLQQIVYSAPWYLDPHNLSRDPKLAELGLWDSSPGLALPTTPEPWRSAGKGILLWQNGWHGAIPGIAGDVDTDFLIGDISTLRPFQWGFRVDPFQGQTTDVPLDVDVPSNSESLDDQKKVARVMLTHASEIATAPVGANLADVAAKIKSEADWLVRSTWGH